MIIIGYPCIGKSSFCENFTEFVDLESSCFSKTNPLWYKDYCTVARDLESQGYNVFVSSHKEVREELAPYQKSIKIVEILPTLEMRDIWVTRVSNRYINTLSAKDKAARDFIIKNYTSGIEDMMADSIEKKVFIVHHVVTQTTQDGKRVLVMKDRPKTKKSLRTLPIVPPFEELLYKLWDKQQHCRKLCGKCCKMRCKE